MYQIVHLILFMILKERERERELGFTWQANSWFWQSGSILNTDPPHNNLGRGYYVTIFRRKATSKAYFFFPSACPPVWYDDVRLLSTYVSSERLLYLLHMHNIVWQQNENSNEYDEPRRYCKKTLYVFCWFWHLFCQQVVYHIEEHLTIIHSWRHFLMVLKS